MKCDNCPALRSEGYEYPEYYCGAGVPENGKMTTSSGCKYSKDKIIKRMERLDELRDRQYDGCDVFFATEDDKNRAMDKALNTALKQVGYGDMTAVIAFKYDDGSFSEIDELNYEIGSQIRSNYEDFEKEVQGSWCDKCKWKNRWQKCSCCCRNRSMKDSFERDESHDISGKDTEHVG